MDEKNFQLAKKVHLQAMLPYITLEWFGMYTIQAIYRKVRDIKEEKDYYTVKSDTFIYFVFHNKFMNNMVKHFNWLTQNNYVSDPT